MHVRHDPSHVLWAQAKAQAARDAEILRHSVANQLQDAQKLAARESSANTTLREQLAKAKAAGPAAVSMPQVLMSHARCKSGCLISQQGRSCRSTERSWTMLTWMGRRALLHIHDEL